MGFLKKRYSPIIPKGKLIDQIYWIICMVTTWVRVQFGVNKHESIFQTQVSTSRAKTICSLWKIYNCLSHQIAREIILLLVSNLHQQHITDSHNGWKLATCAIWNLYSFYNFALVLLTCIQKSIIFLCLFLQTKGKELIINNIIW